MPIIIPSPAGLQITLALIEQTTAPRIGPYYRRPQSATTPATGTEAYIDALKTSMNIADHTSLFMLRRGETVAGPLVTVAADDRQRIVASQDPITGGVLPDRAWTTPPVAGEYIEFHHLDPDQELRPSVRAGLQRCYFEDRATVTLSSAASERDLTASIFWITRPDQVRRFQFTTTGQIVQPADVPWAQPFEQGGHVWLGAWPDEYPNMLLITALRPHFTWVNGADSATGPVNDTDLLGVDLNYAAAAAHIAGWQLFKAKLKMAGDAGTQATQQEAAAEFTRQAVTQRRRRRTGWNLSGPFGQRRFSERVR